MTAPLDRIAVALERIAAALDRAIVPEPAEPTGCAHPEDARVEFGGMGEGVDFFCRACGTHVQLAPLEVTTHV